MTLPGADAARSDDARAASGWSAVRIAKRRVASRRVASRRRLDGVSIARKRVDPEARSARTVPSIRISLGRSISAAGATLGAGCATPSCAQGANARGELELELPQVRESWS